MSFEELEGIYKQIQGGRSKSMDFDFASLTLSAHVVENMPTVETETQPEANLWGIPIHTVDWMPEGFGMGVTACRCLPHERLQPSHIGKHVVVIDFRSEEEKERA